MLSACRTVDYRHSEANKHEIIASRVGSVRALGEAVAACAVCDRLRA